MKKLLFSLCIQVFLATPLFCQATSVLEGRWSNEDGSKHFVLGEMNGLITFQSQSFYGNGANVSWFFQYSLPKGRDIRVGEVLQGRVRSIDGYYNCVFDEAAKAQLDAQGELKVHFPLLSYHRETRSVRESHGYYRERIVDWTGWGWIETIYSFPIENYRMISSQCVVDQRNWVTNSLSKLSP